MRNIYRSPQQTRQSSNEGVSTNNQAAQQPLSFGKITLLLYLIMLYILAIFAVSIVAIFKNQDEGQVILLCILTILLQIILFGSIVYIKLQISEAEDRWYNVIQESEMNQLVYSDQTNFYLLYTDQSKFTWMRLIQIYCSFALLFLVINILDSSYYDCENKKQNRLSSSQKNNQDCTKYTIKSKFQGPMLTALSIQIMIQVTLLFGYHLSVVFRKLEILIYKCQWPVYQYNNLYLNISKTITWSKAFCTIFLVNSIGKFIALVIILILTSNETSQVLIYSNLFYHSFMIIFIIILIRIISSLNNSQQNDDLLFINHQMLIESIIQRNKTIRILFKLFLLLSCIFTVIGTQFFEIQMKMTNVVINYDIFILYDCEIAQLVLIGLMIIKYIIFPIFDFGDIINKFQTQPQENQGQQMLTVEQQQILIPMQRQQEINAIPINDPNGIPSNNQIVIPVDNPVFQLENNKSHQQKLPPISTVEDNFIFQVELLEIRDCSICLQQLVQYSATNRVVQLKCHVNHIFHLKCITNWLNQNKKCPVCNTEFL